MRVRTSNLSAFKSLVCWVARFLVLILVRVEVALKLFWQEFQLLGVLEYEDVICRGT